MPRIGGGGRLLAPSPTYLAIILLLLLLSLLLPPAHGQAICSILDQRMAIVDDRLFFCSGNYTFDDEEILRHSTLKMYWLRLNDTIDVSGPLDPALLGSSTVPSASLSGGRFPDEGGAAGAFFYDHTTLYAYGALAGPEAGATTDKLWAFDTAADNWTLAEVWGGGMHHGDNVEGVHASDPASGASFYTGGSGIAYNGAANGTLVFSTKNSGAQPPEWDFKPASAAGVQGPNILKGAMVHVRRGRAGVLLAFGGYQTAYQGTRPEIFYWDQRPFSEIFVYDISSNTWYQQTATGDLPDPRTEFCAAVSSAPDDSSFQITMQSGG
ncbi:putative kelch repeat protein [Rosellinia necatrix]|uniref:Putative kelch repeat protein n=1 Tax=Rosellinia necatrix TaxID=77044 RepID=A0A1S8A7Y3_ROSNE|nr:putative kelch repeat protein [Rosellinia necatrix]